MYSGGNSFSSYQQNNHGNYQDVPMVGSDYGYGGNMSNTFMQSSNSGSYDTSSGNSGNVPFYMLQSSNYSTTSGSSNFNTSGTSSYNNTGGSGGGTNFSYNYNSNSSYSDGGSYNKPQSQYTAAFQTQGYQSSFEDTASRRKEGGWVKRDSLKRATPYSGTKGTNMLQKMGWTPGQSLGRRQNGQLEPHMPDIKTNRRGFDISAKTFPVQKKKKKGLIGPQPVESIKLVTDGKNPISILEEYSTKRKITPPRYETIVDDGPVHDKTFVFKVIVDGVEYPADKGGKVKKLAKAECARQCLVKLGILPKPTEV